MPDTDRNPIVEDDDPDAPGAPISVPDSGESGEGGKLKMIIGLLKRSLGVKDIAAMRLSLPASLLEPVPNLEYWCYLDRPDLFVDINSSPDPFERLLAVLRFLFSKDTKFVHGKICKPYNSVLGEFFLSHWDVIPVSFPNNDRTQPPIQHLYLYNADSKSALTPTHHTHPDPNPSYSSSKSRVNQLQVSNAGGGKYPPSPTLSARSLVEADSINSSDSNTAVGSLSSSERIRVAFLTEQISHHPPISAFHYTVPSRGLSATGIDQIHARVSGTSVKVAPGAKNKGIFVNIEEGFGKGEKYRITHPTASVGGILTGKFYATVQECSIVTIENGEKWRVIIEYKDESWLGSPKSLMEGVVHTVGDDKSYESWTRVKHVPQDRIVAKLEGCWRDRIRWKRPQDTEWTLLIDVSYLSVMPKSVRDIPEQLPNESRRLWEGVTNHLLSKEYGEATRVKQTIEQAQRDLAASRKKKGEVFQPVYFESEIESGEPILTATGRALLEQESTRVQKS
ncbi:hypothetical protein SISSUDRAFT_1027985 [Sistotremastrum suecicum HHB10207 ss-3]|uniref:Oxysterol-binding protein n=1 Tax=Sistotremastrum suecicum HHB10207 ss-3 TaxID=1314776 RepID=A0A165Y9Z4_9AGAM|nr:hypothetical protein SISSUDRAFT_1027985 [Sistotremastrum suecicum HHB10207 ss-3]